MRDSSESESESKSVVGVVNVDCVASSPIYFCVILGSSWLILDISSIEKRKGVGV